MIEQNLQKTVCLAISKGAEHVEWGRLLSQDWREIIEFIYSHRLGPLLFWSIKNAYQATRNQIPEDVNEQLLLMYVESTRRNLHLFRELALFLDLLDQQNIKTIVLKGASLANTVYHDNGLRPMADIDLLIPVDNLGAAVEMAKSLGYHDPFPEAGPGLKKILSHHEYLIKENQSPVQMEMHHTLLGGDAFRYSVPVDWFFTQVEPFRFQYQDKKQKQLNDEYQNVFNLSPAAQLLFLTAHITFQHGLNASPLIWFYDLDRICRLDSDRINWDVLLEKAGEFHWDSSLSIALLQTREKFNTPLPEKILLQFDRKKGNGYSAIIFSKANSSQTRMQAEWKKIFALNWGGRLRLISALIFPNPAYMRYRYRIDKSWKLPFFYLYRWDYIFLDGLRTILLHLQKK